jgi:hypothetical protein
MASSTWASVSDVLRHPWDSKKRNIEGLAIDLCQAYEITKIAVVKGYDAQWSREDTLRKLEGLKGYLAYLLIDHYVDLSKFDMTGRSFQWNGITLVFLLRCNVCAMAELLSDETGEELSEREFGDLIDQELIMSEKFVAQYTQADLHEAICCLSSKWTVSRPSETLWKYIALLEKQAGILFMFGGPDSAIDGGFGMRTEGSQDRDDLKNSFFCTQEFLSDVTSAMCLFGRTQRNWRAIVSDVPSTTVVDVTDASLLEGVSVSVAVHGFRRWLKDESSSIRSSSTIAAVKKTVQNLCLSVGEKEHHDRPPGGGTNDISAILDESRSTQEAAFWVGKMGMGIGEDNSDFSAIFDEEKMGKYASSIATLRLFHQHVFTRHNFQWWVYYVFLEKDLERMKKIENRPTPVILQFMGLFFVFHRKRIYRTDRVDIALCVWSIFMVKKHDSTHSLLSKKKALPLVGELLDKWLKKDEEDAEVVRDADMVEIKN